MDLWAMRAYLLTVALLVAKYAVVISVQANVRLRTRRFRWAEDAAAWGGTSAAGHAEDELVERAQAALRNDAETQPLFLALAGLWVALGATGAAAWLVLPSYALMRGLHTWWLLRPMQPARNRSFVGAQLLLLLVLGDAARLAWLAR